VTKINVFSTHVQHATVYHFVYIETIHLKADVRQDSFR